jgi:hypothetical protein
VVPGPRPVCPGSQVLEDQGGPGFYFTVCTPDIYSPPQRLLYDPLQTRRIGGPTGSSGHEPAVRLDAANGCFDASPQLAVVRRDRRLMADPGRLGGLNGSPGLEGPRSTHCRRSTYARLWLPGSV